jgi:hypothetical protein
LMTVRFSSYDFLDGEPSPKVTCGMFGIGIWYGWE